MNKHQHRNTQTINRLQHLLDLDTNLTQWADDWAEGYGTTSPTGGHNTGGTSKGDHGTPTEHQALGTTPGAGLAHACEQLHQRIHNVIRDIARLERDARTIEPIGQHIATELAKAKEPRNWGAGDCSICDIYCPGVDEDRLKAGMCPKDYRAWRYAQRVHHSNVPLDRHAWIQQMRESHALTQGAHE